MTADKPREVVIRPAHFADEDEFPGAVATRGPHVAEVIEEYRRDGKVKHTNIADLLTAVSLLHEAFGEDVPIAFKSSNNVPVPVEILDLAIAALTGKWTLREANARRQEEARTLQAQRDALIQEKGLSKREAARRIAKKKFPGMPETRDEFQKFWETLRKKK